MLFFLRPPSKVTNFNTSPMPPPFENFSLDTLKSEQKPSVKIPVDRAGQKPVDLRVNRRWFWNLPVGSGRKNPDRFHLWYNDRGAHGIQKGRWLQQAQQRAHEFERGPSKWHWEISMWGLKAFFFEDHLISTGKIVRISVKTFFFWRSHHNSDKTAAFSPSVLEFTKPEIRHIWAGPGPTFGSRRPWLLSKPTIEIVSS